MNEPPSAYDAEQVLWSATINGQYVRLVAFEAGSAWRCDCDDASSVDANGVPSCEHIKFGFDVWFGREPDGGAVVTDVIEHSPRRRRS